MYLINSTDVFRFDSEKEAEEFLTKVKKSGAYEVVSSTIQKRERKQKGEIIDEWFRLTIKKVYNDEKEPEVPYFDRSEESNVSVFRREEE